MFSFSGKEKKPLSQNHITIQTVNYVICYRPCPPLYFFILLCLRKESPN